MEKQDYVLQANNMHAQKRAKHTFLTKIPNTQASRGARETTQTN